MRLLQAIALAVLLHISFDGLEFPSALANNSAALFNEQWQETEISTNNLLKDPLTTLNDTPQEVGHGSNDTTKYTNKLSTTGEKQEPTLLAAVKPDDEADQRLESLTKEIAIKETELLRLNTNFRIHCTRVSKWKPWRLFFFNLGASGCSNAGIDSITATRWHYWTHPRSLSRTTACIGPVCLFIGHCITLGSVFTETTLDILHDYRVRQEGLDIKTTHKRVLELKDDIDRLLTERASLLAQTQHFSSSDLVLATAEGMVLKDVRDLSLNEYSQFFVRAHKFFANRATNSLLSMAAASTGGFEGSLLGIISGAHRRPQLVGPGGIGFLISGATIVVTPAIERLAANLRGNLARKKLSTELNNLTTKSVGQLYADIAKLQQLASRTDSSEHYNLPNLSRRLSAYSKQNAMFIAQTAMNTNEQALANKELRERMLFAACIGGSKMSWGSNLVNAGFRYHPRSVVQVSKATVQGKAKVTSKTVADLAPSKLFLKRVAIGATSYVPGTGLWIFDTLQNRIRGEMRNHALTLQNNRPGALLEERLGRVEEIDDVFNY